jgi:hypothetical protein
MRKHLRYWDYDGDEILTCPSCGWKGRARDNAEPYDALLDVRCGECDRMLLIVSYPTAAETRAAAAAGNPRAQRELGWIEAAEQRQQLAVGLELSSPDELPELSGSVIRIDWDFEERDGENWTVLRHHDQEIWRELAYYEGYLRFEQVFEILRERYGARLAEVRPTEASMDYLYGDKWSQPAKLIAKLNSSLGDAASNEER